MKSRKRTSSDFIFKEELGHGSYSTVYKAIDRRDNKRIYAIKVCSKAHIIREGKVKYVTIEKNTLNLLARGNHPGIVKLYYTFHDAENLYFALDYAPGGELLSLLHRVGTFNEFLSKHFTVQLLDTLQFIHSQGVIHRDLKPENVLLDKQGRLMITDFGAASTVDEDHYQNEDNNSTSSFVGTAEYVSPELLLYNKCNANSDIWALGCMIYQFLEGTPPFRGENELKTFEKIVALDYNWNIRNYDSTNAKNRTVNPLIIDLVRKILNLNGNERIKLEEIKLEPWLKDVSWDDKMSIWVGIWQLDPTLLQTDSCNQYFSDSKDPNNAHMSGSQQRIIPNRQLHVTDTPLKNIIITKQKKKKPIKISTTTSSIVEWRKKLGISPAHNNTNNPLTTTGLMPNSSHNIFNTAINNNNNKHPGNNFKNKMDKLMNNHTGETLPVPTVPNMAVIAGTNAIVNSYSSPSINPALLHMNAKAHTRSHSKSAPTPYQYPLHINTNTKNYNQEQMNITSVNNNIPNVQYSTLASESAVRAFMINNESSMQPNNMRAPVQNENKGSKSETVQDNPKQGFVNLEYARDILKQDFVYVHEILYRANGPEMTLESYNKIDNDLINTLVSKCKQSLKPVNVKPKILMLNREGYLAYTDFIGQKKHNIVNIGDSDLSMYDFEFDESTRKGFLILEKYKEKIWFISLPNSSQVSQLLDPVDNKTGNVVNNFNEHWVDCFFRARKILEDQKISEGITNLSLGSDSTGANILNHTSTSFDTTPITSAGSSPIEMTKKSSSDKTYPPTSKLPGLNNTNDNSQNRRHLSKEKPGKDKIQYNNLNLNTNVHPNSSPSTIAAQNANAEYMNRENKIVYSKNKSPNSYKKVLTSPVPTHAQTLSNENYLPSRSSINRPSSTPPMSPTPSTSNKKYTPPKNMVISSSRYEVIHTLNSSNSRKSSDHKIASSGASAAFKNSKKGK